MPLPERAKLDPLTQKLSDLRQPDRPYTAVHNDHLVICRGADRISLTKKELFCILDDVLEFSRSEYLKK
jgi:hypothetical protein